MDDVISPKVTVLMAVFNGEKFLGEAISSILSQTFTDFEFLIINDGSTDRSEEIIQSFNDKRINYVSNEHNIGCVESLNKGLLMAKANIIARMDADDISKPTRIEKQYNFLNANKDVDIIGCHINFIDEHNKTTDSYIYPIFKEEIKAMVLFGSPFGHPCVMFRNEKFQSLNLIYRQDYHYAEDYDLWQRVLTKLNGANYNEILLDYRISSSQVSNIHSKEQQFLSRKIKVSELENLGLSEKTINNLSIFLLNAFELTQAENFANILIAISELLRVNENMKIYNDKVLKEMVVSKLEKIVIFYSSRTFPLLRLYKKSEFYKYNNLSIVSFFKCFIKQIVTS